MESTLAGIVLYIKLRAQIIATMAHQQNLFFGKKTPFWNFGRKKRGGRGARKRGV
jgi:hypothetical protein